MSGNCVNWLFGRGLSIACGLTWVVPNEWGHYSREEKIREIKTAIRKGMGSATVDCTLIIEFLRYLGSRTAPGWRHRFITTNWDYLLQREIDRLPLGVQPDWMDNSHVFHLNGTVENLPDNSNRSPFLLEEDPAEQRRSTVEADIVFNQMIWDRMFVVVGMSFECETDRFLLQSLQRVEDDMAVGEGTWFVVNPNESVLTASCSRIRDALPNAAVVGRSQTLESWMADDFHGLDSLGVFS